MEVITPVSPERDYSDKKIVFLAGPIKGAPDWQAQAVKDLADLDVYVANPRRENVVNFNLDLQVDWESRFLALADVIMFWIPPKIADVAICEEKFAKFLPDGNGQCLNNETNCLLGAKVLPATETQCNGTGKYYYTGSSCANLPSDLSKMTCNSGYVLDETAHRCNKIAGCSSFVDGACVCDKYYYKKEAGCVSFEEGCGSGWLEKNRECIEASDGCGENYKDLGGWCNRVIYTPAEAAPLLTDKNNTVTITFRK